MKTIQEIKASPLWEKLTDLEHKFLEALAQNGNMREAVKASYNTTSDASAKAIAHRLKSKFPVSYLSQCLLGQAELTRHEIEWHIADTLRTTKNETLKAQLLRMLRDMFGMRASANAELEADPQPAEAEPSDFLSNFKE